jgi:transposase
MVNNNNKLTNKEALILDLINSGEYTIEDIVKEYKSSKSIIYRHIRNLTKKGWEIDTKEIGSKKTRDVKPKGSKTTLNKWRYHALEFEVRPFRISDRYYKLMKKNGNHSLTLGNWKYCMYYKKIILWLEAGKDFEHPNKDVAIRMCTFDFNRVLTKLQKHIGVDVFKDRKMNIRMLKQHLAYTDAPEFEAITQTHMQIYGEDGKVFMVYDKSKGGQEREYVHSQKAIDDSDHIEPFFDEWGDDNIKDHINDIRNNKPLTLTNMQKKIFQYFNLMTKNQSILTKNVAQYTEQINIHIPALHKIGTSAETLGSNTNELTQVIKKMQKQSVQSNDFFNEIGITNRINKNKLDNIKNKIHKKTDVLQYRNEINKLNASELSELSQWIINKYD